jgi:hypothetical protein
MARPKKKEDAKRTAHMPRTRCTLAERATIEARAAQAGLSMSDYTRQMAMTGHVIVREPVADIQLITRLNGIASELNAIGRNINQMTRLANIHQKMDAPRLDDIAAALRERLSRLDDCLTEMGA